MKSNMSVRSEINSVIVDSVISFLKGCEITQSTLKVKSSIPYLLGQTVRQYQVAPENWHISKAAQDLWSSMTSADIADFGYTEQFVADRLVEPTSVYTFKGGERKLGFDLQLDPKGTYVFNRIFVVEHVTPAADIIKALHEIYREYKDSPLLREKVVEVLDKIHLARILRSEDRSIGKCSGRLKSSDVIFKSSQECFDQVNREFYVPSSIILK